MSKEKQYPSVFEQGKNLSKFTWDVINYITNNQEKVLFVSDEVYRERITICKGCDKYDEFENKCVECGCYLPGKARIILDSCPLKKWNADEVSWDEKFNMISKDLDNSTESL